MIGYQPTGKAINYKFSYYEYDHDDVPHPVHEGKCILDCIIDPIGWANIRPIYLLWPITKLFHSSVSVNN